jgi:hypothetical protein|tara:strand:- start:163 stop:264 length:102 start_codon:yes stop_codon:yes gene_type:complete
MVNRPAIFLALLLAGKLPRQLRHGALKLLPPPA